MTKTLTSSVTARLQFNHRDDPDDQGRYKINNNTVSFVETFANGTGAGQCNLVYEDTGTILDGNTSSLDLAGGLSDAFGGTLTFVKVKAIYIYNQNTTTGENLLVGGAAANQFINWVSDATDEVVVGPSGVFCLASPVDGYAVTAGTGDILQLEADGGDITYDIVIVGVSA